MKATGIVRKIDQLGRLVIPKETRRLLGVKEDTPMEFFVDGEFIMIRKYKECCAICGSTSVEKSCDDVKLCLDCILKIKEL